MTMSQLRAFVAANPDLHDDTQVLCEDPNGWGHQLIDIEIGTALLEFNKDPMPVIIIGKLDNSEAFETGR